MPALHSVYTLHRALGRGALATVYLAEHKETGEMRAIKILHADDATQTARLRGEGRIQSTLDHPNIVRVWDTLDLESGLALVMELVDGPSLAELISHEHPIDLAAIDALAHGLFAGVKAAHAAGVVHRDLKPANVLIAYVDGAWTPRITDFGIAKHHADPAGLTRAGQVLGTPAYMAPEQARHAAAADERADVFSLGCVLYEVVTGRRAFTGNDAMGALRAVAEGHYTPIQELRAVPERIQLAIAGALIGPVEQRIPSVQELQAVWSGAARFDVPTLDSETVDFSLTVDAEPATVRIEPPHGREALFQSLAGDRLGQQRVVALFGPIGAGKTHLAHALAHSEQRGRAVVLCDLTRATTAEAASVALAGVLGLQLDRRSPGQSVAHELAIRDQTIFVLDGVDGVSRSGVLQDWAAAVHPSATLLLTSRQRLPGLGAASHRVGPLPVESAAALFVALGRMHGATLTADDDTVRQLVERLDGLPLTLELAAARLSVLSVEAILAGLERRFQMLRDPNSTRHSLEQCLAWSWDLLDATAAHTLEALCVYGGPFSLEDAEAVRPPSDVWIVDQLQQLVEHSLLQLHEDGRYSILQNVRAYGLARLNTSGSATEVELKQAAWLARQGDLGAADTSLRQGSVRATLARGADIPTLLEVLQRPSTATRPEWMTGLAVALWLRVRLTGPLHLGMEQVRRALDLATVPSHVVLLTACLFEGMALTGEDDELEDRYASALDATEELQPLVFAVLLDQYGRCIAARGDYRGALDAFENAHALHTSLGVTTGAAVTLAQKGITLYRLGQVEEAVDLLEQAHHTLVQEGHTRMASVSLWHLGRHDLTSGRPERGLLRMRHAVQQVGIDGDRVFQARLESWQVGALARVVGFGGSLGPGAAHGSSGQGLARCEQKRRWLTPWEAARLEGLGGRICARMGDVDEAAHRIRSTVAYVRQMQHHTLPGWLNELGYLGTEFTGVDDALDASLEAWALRRSQGAIRYAFNCGLAVACMHRHAGRYEAHEAVLAELDAADPAAQSQLARGWMYAEHAFVDLRNGILPPPDVGFDVPSVTCTQLLLARLARAQASGDPELRASTLAHVLSVCPHPRTDRSYFWRAIDALPES